MSKKNRCLTKLGFSGAKEADQLLEAFRRTKLILFLKKVCAELNLSVKIEINNQLTVQTRLKAVKKYDTEYDKLFRPELQEMFKVSPMCGYIKRSKHGSSPVSEASYLAILSDFGILLLDISKFDFKGFVPVLGTHLKNTSSIRKDVKGGVIYSIDIILGTLSEKETLVFSSEADKQEWTTKIIKTQEKNKTN